MSDDKPPERPDRGRRKRAGRPKKTIAVKMLTKHVLEAGWNELGGKSDSELAVNAADRPRTWGECQAANTGIPNRPCPWVSCKYHLYLDVDPDTGSIITNHPNLEPWELVHSCALRVAEQGGATLEEVGEILNVTRERVRQIEVRAQTRKLYPQLRVLELDKP